MHHAFGDAVVDAGEAVGPVGTGLQLLIEPRRVAVQVQDTAGRREQVVEIRPAPGRVVDNDIGLPIRQCSGHPLAGLTDGQGVTETEKPSARPTGYRILPEDQETRINALVSVGFMV